MSKGNVATTRTVRFYKLRTNQSIQAYYGLVPFKRLTINEIRAFTVDCRSGPKIWLGHTITKSSPYVFPYSRASLSASVFERQYQFYNKKRKT